MKTEILKLLRKTDGYISGQQISDKFGVSRTAVWKVIRQLQEDGYQVEAVRNKGYRIVDSPDVITKEELDSLMKTCWVGRNILYYDVTDSTNLRIRQAGDEGAPHGTLAVADRQTAGRGRRGRHWESPAGTSIYMSLLLRPETAPDKASMLTLVMAVSAAEGIREGIAAGRDTEEKSGSTEEDRRQSSPPEIQIKWPNDIIINGKKAAGILTEMSSQIDYIEHVVIGMGINANTVEFPEEIRGTATSLRLEYGYRIRRAPLIAAVMKRFEENYKTFLETEDLSGLKDRYSAMLVNRDRDVLIAGPKETYPAHALDISRTGELIVRREDGTVERIFSGEVSVRGVYGYV